MYPYTDPAEEEANILAILADGNPRTEAEITKALGRDWPVSICLLERMQAAGAIELSLTPHLNYVARRKQRNDQARE
jgi:hypothetical protein